MSNVKLMKKVNEDGNLYVFRKRFISRSAIYHHMAQFQHSELKKIWMLNNIKRRKLCPLAELCICDRKYNERVY